MIRSLAILMLATILTEVRGHFTMLLPGTSSAKKGEEVIILYQFGHPFEHQLFDAPPPARMVVLGPDGKSKSLTKTLEKIKVKGTDGKDVVAYRIRFTPELRGDFTFFLNTPPIWMSEDKEFLQDTVQVVLHVQAQKGWDLDRGPGFKILPLTRPYGLRPGMVFQGEVRDRILDPEGAFALTPPLKGLPVFIERFNPKPPKELPADELITFAAKTDPNGVLTTTLPSPGWWSITAQRNDGSRNYQGKDYPVRKRTTLWVYVDDKE